jgi:hypothetical protein
MAHNEYDLLICGATFAGLGAAQAAKEAGRSALVIERTAATGKEYVNTFNPGRHWGKPLQLSSFAAAFRDDLLRRNLMEPGGPVHLPAMHPLLCLLIKESALKVQFLTEIVEVTGRDGGYAVRLINAAGLHEVKAREIIDTSSQGLTKPGNLSAPAGKRLNAYLHYAGSNGGAYSEDLPDLPPSVDGAVSAVRGRYPSEIILRFTVVPTDDWPEARPKLHRYWQARPAAWGEWTIAAVADEFESLVEPGVRRIEERWSWLPSEGCDHPLEALEQGYRFVQLGQREGSRDAALA